ncbi:MAG: glycosyltransferase family A protein [Deltaproteobacteria bacterium]|nr:glycosyltransferase family A protein [Deltaproteobacteria bacterium]
MSIQHVVVTPVHNEQDHLPALLRSMAAQTLPPTEWILVDDHSTDGTRELIEAFCLEHPWARRIEGDVTVDRELGGKVARLFLQGLSRARTDWEFLSKIDADLTLPDDYFERVFQLFADRERLGIAGGGCYEYRNGKKWYEAVPPDHTRGALKTYRRACWDEWGGVRPVNGWDGIDGFLAQMNGWQTRSFPEIEVIHHRPSGSARGVIRGRFRAGEFAHFMGYHPLFLAARCLRRAADRPAVLGSLALGAGFVWSHLRDRPVFEEREVVEYLRERQLRRLGLGVLLDRASRRPGKE